MKKQYDAIVIGGGMTGSYAAKNLCQAGLKTLMLERGPEKQHPDSYTETHKRPWDYRFKGVIEENLNRVKSVQSRSYAFTSATEDSFVDDLRNPYAVAKDKPFNWIQSYQLGGRSLLWGRQSYRFSDLDFSANLNEGVGVDWPIRYRDLKPFYEEVEKFVGISGQKENISHLPDGIFLPPMAMNDMDLNARKIISEKWPNRKLIMGRTANLTKPHNGRGACIYRNKCSTGCPHGGYYSGLSGAIPVAMDTGNLDIKCDAIVERIVYDKTNRLAKSVRVIDANTHQDNEYHAPVIFLCAGTLNSTRILLHSSEPDGIGLASKQLGHNLMDHHNLVVGGVISGGPKSFPQGHRPTDCYIPRFRNVNQDVSKNFKRGYGFQFRAQRASWTSKFYSNDIGTDLKESLGLWGPWIVALTGFGETLPDYNNFVTLNHQKKDNWGLPTLEINASFNQNEKAMNRDMIASGIEIIKALGCKEPQVWKPFSVPGDSVHEMGTARMGKDPETSVLDPYNRVWEARNVYVTDGSAMASSACQNPSLTYMALTARAVKTIVSDLKKGKFKV